MSSFSTRKQALAARLQHRVSNGANRFIHIGQGTPRHAQLLAAILLPFVLVIGFVAAQAVKSIVVSLVPAGVNPGIDAVLWLTGVVLFITVLVIGFIWVRTGGFRIFA